MKIEIKLSEKEIITRIRKHSREIKIPRNKIMISKKQKQKDNNFHHLSKW